MINELNERSVPELLPREEMLMILLKEEYGFLPQSPTDIQFEVKKNIIPNFCAGNATCDNVTAHCKLGDKDFSFDFKAILPTDNEKHPFFVHVNFRSDIPDRHQPTEEIIDNGFALLTFCYEDVTKDDGDFTDGLAGVLYENGERSGSDAGKIAMWAWAAQRVMDYAQTLSDRLDLDCGIMCGHSRLGKTALLTAATDERFAFAYSNDSGCSGAAITRKKQGETIDAIYKKFPFWFCENYKKYVDDIDSMPFDQHYLIASIAPRKVLIGSACDDIWADPYSEQLACFGASRAFENGFICPDRKAEVGEKFFDGHLGYHLRKGLHYFSREDWNRLIEFVKIHK